MKIIAMANGGFSIPTLRALNDSRHEIVALIAMPDRTKKKNGKSGASPVRDAANDFLANVPFFDPENVNSPEGVELVRSLNADLIFICDYGRILSKQTLESTKFGGINLHGSLLPKYRGAAPINRAIQAGERELGVSVIFIEPRMDAGPVVGVDSYRPSLEDTAVEIENALAEMGAPLVLKAVDAIETGTIVALPQSDEEATKAPKLRKEEGKIDWSQTSRAVVDQYRAFQPWPRVYSDFVSAAQDRAPTRIILGPISEFDANGQKRPLDDAARACPPGVILEATKKEVWVRTGDGEVRILGAQVSGKKHMPIDAFLRGFALRVGDRFE